MIVKSFGSIFEFISGFEKFIGMIQVFFLLNIQPYKKPATFTNDCPKGVVGGDSSAAYTSSDSDKVMEGVFCPTSSSIKIWYKMHADTTRFWFYTNSGKHSHECDEDGHSGCCTIEGTLTNFSPNRCYPYWSKLDANCWGETDWVEIKYNDVRLKGDSYTCLNYDNCKGLYWGDKCDHSVPAYTENFNCEVSLGRTGDGSCNCGSATKMQDYCINKYSPNGVQYYWRENPDEQWGSVKGTLTDKLHLKIAENNNYYNQYRIVGKILFIDKSKAYNFQLVTKTPATFKIGDKETKGESNFLHCDPTGNYYYTLNYGNPSSVGLYDVVIEVDTGCAINEIDVELKWIVGSGTYSSIPGNYLFH